MLSAGAGWDRRISSEAEHAYAVTLKHDQFLHLVAYQNGVDVAIRLEPPLGAPLVVDSPNGPQGPEILAWVARREGVHRVRVSSLGGRGAYRLEVVALRQASSEDRRLAEAIRSYVRAGESAALEAYRRTAELARALERPLLEARALAQLGRLLHRQGESPAAAPHFERSLALVSDHGNAWEHLPLLNDAGMAFRAAGEPQRARAAYEEALELAEELGHDDGKANALNNLGVLHHSLGELRQALAYYDRSLSVRRSAGQGGQATLLHNLGQIYASLGRTEESRSHFEQAIAAYRLTGDTRGEAASTASLGSLYQVDGDIDGALELYDRALAWQRETGGRGLEAALLEMRGTALRLAGREREALATFRRVLGIFGELGRPLDQAHTLVEVGELQTAMGQPGLALQALGRALDIFERAGVLQGQAAALFGAASAERALEHLADAKGSFERGLELVESVRGRLQSGPLRRSYTATRNDHYGAYVDLLMELERRQDDGVWARRAFEASERARGRDLVERLASFPTGAASHAAPELVERRDALRREIQAKELRRVRGFGDGARGATAEALDRELLSLLLEYEKLESAMAAGEEPLRDLPLAAVQRELLDEGTDLLVYRLGASRSFLWRVTRDDFDGWELSPRAEIESLARRVHELLPQSHVPGVELQAQLASNALSDLVLAPLAETLTDADDRRWVIVSDGALLLVPFAALPVKDGAERVPLVRRREIVHLPSLGLLASLRRRHLERPPAEKKLAVIADPIFERHDPRLSGTPTPPASRQSLSRDVERSLRDFGPASFERLPHSGHEARALLALVPESDRFAATGVAASRETVLSGELGRYQIVHFATHGLLNTRHPALSGLLLSQWDEAGRPRPGLLWAHELADLHLSADLVVVSACRTALGKEVRGEGLLGMPRGFFAAGASRVMVSHWSVDDQATARLMTLFYRRLLADGLAPAAALRAAQLGMLDTPGREAPYFWAGFALQGEWR